MNHSQLYELQPASFNRAHLGESDEPYSFEKTTLKLIEYLGRDTVAKVLSPEYVAKLLRQEK